MIKTRDKIVVGVGAFLLVVAFVSYFVLPDYLMQSVCVLSLAVMAVMIVYHSYCESAERDQLAPVKLGK